MTTSDTLIVGDVHGCADELHRLVSLARDTAGGPVHVVLVGDLFTKGPDPAGVWEAIWDRGMEAVLGNHDQRLLDVIDGKRPKDRSGARTVESLTDTDPGWEAWVRALPLWRDVEGYRVTHAALHPSGDPARTERYTHLYRRRWNEKDSKAPRWWRSYEGPPVVFGHDAVQGLVYEERDGRPWILGLDTGCVYGGRLTGFLTRAERLLHVDAGRAYKAV